LDRAAFGRPGPNSGPEHRTDRTPQAIVICRQPAEILDATDVAT